MHLRHTSRPALALAAFITIVTTVSGTAAGDLLQSHQQILPVGKGQADLSGMHLRDRLGDDMILGFVEDQPSDPTGGPGQKKNRDLGWQAATNQDDPNEFHLIMFGSDIIMGGEGPGGIGHGLRDTVWSAGDVLASLVGREPVTVDRSWYGRSEVFESWQPSVVATSAEAERQGADQIPSPGSSLVFGLLGALLISTRARRP
ncbi:MAG: hypothetical protein D8M59_03350 [Planctomycetes bacterium]|nr:hypothetical protein [Planctomycetota bacterium]NOG53033.1 hypothetical protein [Planctomycetota bacterium]